MAIDLDGDRVRVTVHGLPKGLNYSCQPTMGRLTKCPVTGTPKKAGTYSVTVKAVDSKGTVTKKAFSLKINQRNNSKKLDR